MTHQQSIPRKLLAIALPAMVENLLQMLMGTVDGYLVAVLGLAAVSGVSVANNLTAVYQAVFIALGAAVSSSYSAHLARKEEGASRRLMEQALTLTILLSLGLGLLSILMGEQTLALLGTEPRVRQAGGLYLATVGGGILFLGLMTTLGSLLRSQGKPRLPMYVSLLSNLLNALLSAISVFWLGMGVFGVALATVLSRMIGSALLFSALDLGGSRLRWSWRLDQELLRLTLPAAGERLMMRIGDIAIVAIIVSFGTRVVAGNAIGETLTQFNYMPGMGLATATVILVARARGEGSQLEQKKLVSYSYWIALVTMGLVSGLIFLLGRPLTALYTNDSQAVAASVLVAFYAFIGTPAMAGTLVMTAVWQGLGNARLPFYATSLGMWMIRIGLGVLLGIWLKLGLAGVWIATVADNVFRWLFLTALYIKKGRS
ncbi:MATE family efflux transporter [Streptococcus sp. DD13]|uniref:MATE family efflux transporter n=1 Tax=Streptococcus sp. DD13 TaxID=1777881 RepID=UPI000791A8AA|nr:MATE family efflux transporter [Streptococcus sp. DD13]KXT78010.1 Multi antimicrobial extrusion (MATE) family transporter [Streptococcus sp. DD13]